MSTDATIGDLTYIEILVTPSFANIFGPVFWGTSTSPRFFAKDGRYLCHVYLKDFAAR